ncbi:hypothetical protein CRM79_00980 [Pantoea agglomerans]|nr:hypothetical protein CRM79_00980 [Pantoea agglomerans]
MSFAEFASFPVFISVMVFLIWLIRKGANKTLRIKIFSVLGISGLSSFVYPALSLHTGTIYHCFAGFYRYCAGALLISVVLNVIVLLFFKLKGDKYERT